MADKKISELDALTGAAVATDDQLIIVDTSAGLTKNITIDEFKNALDTSTGFVRITGDTMTGDLDVQGTVTADGLTVDGTTTTDGLNLDAISDTIEDTAVDIFVYDTRKDSDGGAWRKRTQHTSWYNETLNTATRGSRKEFPSVAVIVVNSDTGQNLPHVTIYDGDDPDLPMWMEFTRVSQDPYLSSYTNGATMVGNYPVGAVSAKNGILSFGSTRSAGALSGLNAGLRVINFVSDSAIAHSNTDAYVFPNNISQRDTLVDASATSGAIVNVNANDVAMTVLPNAPIDAATGLPVPTIAVATEGGHSFILDNGNVVDLLTTTYTDTDNVSFTDNGRTYNLFNDGGFVSINELPSADISSGSTLGGGIRLTRTGTPAFSPDFSSLGTDIVAKSYDEAAIGTGSGLTNLEYTSDASGDSRFMVNYATSDYATGWMNGDIKLATLSDTDDTDVTGSELVTNGTFDSDTSGWNAFNSSLSVVSNALRVTVTTGGSIAYAYQSLTTEVGKVYTATADVVTDGSNGNKFIFIGTAAGSNNIASVNTGGVNATGVISVTFTATSTTTYISLLISTAAASAQFDEFDNVSVRLAEEDRSVNGNGLQVFGTVTKNPVATGADLVAYSGFSNNDYLQQPVNTDLQFGTGDFCAMGWFKTTNADTEPFYFYGQYTTGWVGGGQHRVRLTSGYMNFAITDDNWGSSDQITSGATYNNNTWHHYCGVRRGNQIELYANGVLVASTAITAATGSISNTGATLNYGRRQDGSSGAVTTGSLALSRISATAPSPEQIAKIYEDEKVLFQENAQATLYGSSDAVTALAYDDTTNILSVGTSAGRSDFQGLRRVNNTTTGVTTSISASNGLIVEQ